MQIHSVQQTGEIKMTVEEEATVMYFHPAEVELVEQIIKGMMEIADEESLSYLQGILLTVQQNPTGVLQ